MYGNSFGQRLQTDSRNGIQATARFSRAEAESAIVLYYDFVAPLA